VPVGDVLVGNSRGHIEHDDTTLSIDVVTVTKTTKLLLTSRVPDIEGDVTEVLISCQRECASGKKNGDADKSFTYGGEAERVNLYTKSCHVLLLELTSQVTLDEGGLSKLVVDTNMS
jgi:hypothetical protein